MRAHSSRIAVVLAGTLASCNALTGVGDLAIGPGETAPLEAGGSRTDAVSDTNLAPPDVAAPDGGADAGDCPAFATFCDDFESGNLTKWTQLLQTNDGKVSVVGTTVFAGQRALHATAGPSKPVNGNYPSVGAGARVTVPTVTSAMISVRAYVFMPAILGSETTFLKIFGKNGVDDMNVKIAAGGLVKVDSDVPDAGPEITGTDATPIAQWFCVEWQSTIGTAGHQRVLVDGKAVVDADENTFTSQGYDSVQVGFNAAEGSVTQQLYFDEVVTATQPIGCK